MQQKIAVGKKVVLIARDVGSCWLCGLCYLSTEIGAKKETICFKKGSRENWCVGSLR